MTTLPPEVLARLRERLEAVAKRAAGDQLAIKTEAEARGRLEIMSNDMLHELERWKADELRRLRKRGTGET